MIIDIILFAVFAAFIGLKLFNTLGRKDYNHDLRKQRDDKKSKVVNFPKPSEKEEDAKYEIVKDDYEELAEKYSDDIAKGFKDINKIEKSFNEKDFITGAESAFEYILKAFNQGDKSTLKNLLIDDLYKDFEQEIDDRKNSDRIESDTLIAILQTDIKNIDIQNRVATIKVEFLSEQINVIKNNDGEIIEGSPSDINKISEVWVFRRKLNSSTPNWLLVSADEA